MARGLVTKGIQIKADAKGNLPDAIELLHTGSWNAPWHGEWETTPGDLTDYVRNFDSGIGLVQGDKRAHINFDHMVGKAAGWIKKLFTSDDDTRLLGEVEWTESGREALMAGEYCYISPEFNPRAYPWEDPEEEYHFVPNVLTAAALTNAPLHKKLKPVMASAAPPKKPIAGSSGKDNKDKGDEMDLSTLRTKKKDELSADELKFVEEHKADLTADELQALGLEAAQPPENKDEPTEDEKEAQKLQASIKAGTHVILSSADYQKMKASVEANAKTIEGYEREKIKASVDKHVERGAIKSEDAGKWVEKIMADRSLETMLDSLPDSPKVKGSAHGDSNDGHTTPITALEAEVKAIQASDKGMSYKDALARVRQEKPELYSEYQKEMGGAE